MNKFAFFFPGQGSQSIGMMKGFEEIGFDAVFNVIRDTFIEASDILNADFWSMATMPNEIINDTSNTQPLMLIAGFATWRAWTLTSKNLPTILAGHSLGEYTALVASEALSFSEALPLVRFRAQVMQSAVPAGTGAMAAILGLSDDEIKSVCNEAAHEEVLEAVNYNSPGQVVIAGNKDAVERGMELAKKKGAKRTLPLPVSVPSHCALMKPAAEKLSEYLKNVTINTSKLPVIQNADVMSYTNSEQIKDALVRQLYSPVRWVETVKFVHSQGITQSAECGPGKVLAGLAKRITTELSCVALTNNEALNDFQTKILTNF